MPEARTWLAPFLLQLGSGRPWVFTYLYYLQLYQQFFSVLFQEMVPEGLALAPKCGLFQSR